MSNEWNLIPMSQWTLTPALRNYKATPRIISLSHPVQRLDYKKHLRLPIKVKKNALKAKATPRVTELAAAKDRADVNFRQLPAQVSPGALTCEASERVKELATPRKPVKKYTSKKK